MKKHFEILDGLRGLAAFSVVALHLLESWYPNSVVNPMHHANLAVDFFFLLSGFVVGHAYDKREGISIRSFFQIRITRLHPMVLMGVTIGILAYVFDPFAGEAQRAPWLKILVIAILSYFLLPTAALPNRDNATHSLNGPSWSLFQEYLANIAYILFLRRMRNGMLIVAVCMTAFALCLSANRYDNIQGGWSWSSFWIAPVRVAFPFLAGLLLFRLGIRIKVSYALPFLSFLLLLVFMLPYFRFNGSYESFCILFIFPIIVATGAGSQVSPVIAKFCQWAGRLSYPIYLIHYPLVMIYAHWIKAKQPSGNTAFLVGISLFIFFILFSWFLCRFYDEPVRKWLSTKWNRKRGNTNELPPAAQSPGYKQKGWVVNG